MVLYPFATTNIQALKRVRIGRFGNALQTVKKELSIWKRFTHRHIVILREVIDTDGASRMYSSCSSRIVATT